MKHHILATRIGSLLNNQHFFMKSNGPRFVFFVAHFCFCPFFCWWILPPFFLGEIHSQDLPKLVAGVAAKISHRSMESEIPKVVKFRRGSGFWWVFLGCFGWKHGFYLMALWMESNGVKKPYRSRVVFVGKKWRRIIFNLSIKTIRRP